jgi:hypothetical protein
MTLNVKKAWTVNTALVPPGDGAKNEISNPAVKAR